MEEVSCKVTVIVPVYNVQKYLDACIQSILAQSFREFKLLLVDDGSTDSSLDICRKYEVLDSRVEVYTQSNQGPSAARNKGLELVKTPWLCFIDSDDIVKKDYLLSFFKFGEPSSDELVIQGMELVREQTSEIIRIVKSEDILITPDNCSDLIPQHKVLHHGFPVLKLFNTELIRKSNLNFDTSFSFHEDHVFVLQYLRYIKKIRLVSTVLYQYILHEGSLTSKQHPYLSSEQSLETLSLEFTKTLEHFRISDRNYIRSINTFLSHTIFRTVLYAYRAKTKSSDCLLLLSRLKKYRANLLEMNYEGGKLLVMRLILLLPSIRLQNLLLNLVS